jgi:hypothetical protein
MMVPRNRGTIIFSHGYISDVAGLPEHDRGGLDRVAEVDRGRLGSLKELLVGRGQHTSDVFHDFLQSVGWVPDYPAVDLQNGTGPDGSATPRLRTERGHGWQALRAAQFGSSPPDDGGFILEPTGRLGPPYAQDTLEDVMEKVTAPLAASDEQLPASDEQLLAAAEATKADFDDAVETPSVVLGEPCDT